MNRFLKDLLLGIVTLFIAVAVGYLLMVLVYLIPVDRMHENMVRSCDVFSREGTYPKCLWNYNSRLDNFTDAAMLVMASTEYTESPWNAALDTITRQGQNDMTPDELLVAIYRDGYTDFSEYVYARYWEGFLVFVKPLLCICSYPAMRIIVMLNQLILMGLLIFLCMKQEKRLILPLIGMWLFLNPVATTQSLQFNTVFSITLIMMIFILLIKRRDAKGDIRKRDIIFLLGGCAAAYFDLLTFPLLSWGAPLAVWIFINKEQDIKRELFDTAEMTVFWAVGYAGMWSAKWILATCITGKDIIANALNEAAGWTSTSGGRLLQYFYVLLRNVGASVQVTVIIYVAVLAVMIIHMVKKNKYAFGSFICYVLLMLAPFVWYFITVAHSFRHYWFTYRNMGVSIIALHLLMLKMKETAS